jgi:hypothetical protein
MCASSMTRMPVSGPAMVFSPLLFQMVCNAG